MCSNVHIIIQNKTKQNPIHSPTNIINPQSETVHYSMSEKFTISKNFVSHQHQQYKYDVKNFSKKKINQTIFSNQETLTLNNI